MPKGVTKNTTKSKSKKAMSAEKNNKAVISSVMEGGKAEDYEFARIDANLGSGGFRILTNSGVSAIGRPRKIFTAATMGMKMNDIVICSQANCNAEAKVQTYEIVGLLSKKDGQTLYKAGRISRHVWATDEEDVDDVFDYEEEDAELDIDAI